MCPNGRHFIFTGYYPLTQTIFLRQDFLTRQWSQNFLKDGFAMDGAVKHHASGKSHFQP